ncbi:MAG TPA: hypothetical protein VMT85_01855 [Thermoanaerobaculia bacterium]|nr:hypothetical protein [Thermoanaerobaculia bacterium]
MNWIRSSVALLLSLSLSPSLLVAEGAADTEADPNVVVSPELFGGMSYRMVGPHRGGRVTAVAGVVQHPETFYMGATGGGVWRTDDLGTTWRNLSDGFFATSSIGAIDVADSDPNVVYVGTGSACIRSNIITGRGVYGSTDGGDTWRFLGLRESGAIGDLVIHPDDPDLLYVAALGHIFGPNEERGVFRSRDGGESWEKVLWVSERTGAVDLSMDPSNPRKIFASAWTAERKPWTILSGSEESGLFVTHDRGDTWQRVTEGLPSGLVGKIAVEVSPADPDRVWALVEAPGDARGLYRSEDGGKSFRMVNGQISLTYRPWYYTHLTADPKNRDKIFVSNETFWLSVDGGDSFERRPTPHVDNHAMWIHPDDPDRMVQGNDGGANVSWNGGETWSPQWNQPTAELYQVAVDNAFPYRLYGAQQDNSTISVPSRISRRPEDPKQDWLVVSGCETGPVVPHPERASVIYGGCKGRHSVLDLATGQERHYWVYPHFNYGHDTRDMPYRFQRTAPMILSPHDPQTTYHGSHVLHRSRDEGRTWETISPDLTAFEDETQGYSGGPITRDITGEEIYSTIYAIAESPLEQGVLWVGANDGPIHLSRDGGASWSDVTPQGLPRGGRVNRIEASPHARGRAYAAIYRFQLDDWEPYVYRTDDYGRSWRRLTDGSNGIPADTPVRVVREDPEREDLLYAGTEFGMYTSFDGGRHWQPFQLDLPVTPITEIVVHRGDLVLSTMGRSFWILDDLTRLHQLGADAAAGHRLYSPRPVHRVDWVSGLERSFPGHAPEYPESGAFIDYTLAADVEEIRLEVLDAAGDVTRAFDGRAVQDEETEPAMGGPPFSRSRPGRSLATVRGSHRFVWDLRLEGPRPLRGGRGDSGGGPMVLAGRYPVRLTVGDWSQTAELEVLADPRVTAAGITTEDLEAQVELQTSVRDAIERLRRTVRTIRGLREQTDDLRSRASAARLDEDGELGALAGRVREALSELEGLLVQVEEGKVGAELEPQLDSQLTYLYGMISSADQRPGQDAYDRFADVEEELASHVAALEALRQGELAELNRLADWRKVPAIIEESSAEESSPEESSAAGSRPGSFGSGGR